jgi:hypothetical protein
MKVLSSIPHQLRGRGHNQCTPIQCECGEKFLFGLSDGVISDGDLNNDTVPVKCPTCKMVEQMSSASLVAHNGQAK